MRALLVTGVCQAFEEAYGHLREGGYTVQRVSTGQLALQLARNCFLDVVVLNLNLPDMPGAEVIRRLREAGIQSPVVAVSTAPEARPRIAALQAGADDALTLPLDAVELRERLQAVLRRGHRHTPQVLSAGPVSFDPNSREVLVANRPVHLSAKETAVLELLLLRRGAPVAKEVFLDLLYSGADGEPDGRIIDTFVCKVRRKLAAAGAQKVIETVFGFGCLIRNPHPTWTTEAAVNGAQAPGALHAVPKGALTEVERRFETV